MDIELIVKVITVIVTGFGTVLALLHFLTTTRSHGYQNSKTEMELLSQGIAAYEAEPGYTEFLTAVRKERISSLLFGISIPNVDLERVITYHRKAEGTVTTRDIAKAWQYRDLHSEQLSFKLRGPFKRQYIFVQAFAVFCIVSVALGVGALQFGADARQAILLICVALVAVFLILSTSQGLFTAARLAKLEKDRPEISNEA